MRANVATMPEARGKGVGAYISSAPLVEARGDGYRVSILHASDLGRPVYTQDANGKEGNQARISVH